MFWLFYIWVSEVSYLFHAYSQVIGDRIGIPSALVRGEFSRAWNEVAVSMEYEVWLLLDYVVWLFMYVMIYLLRNGELVQSVVCLNVQNVHCEAKSFHPLFSH